MTRPPLSGTQHVVMWSGGITSWATARHVIAEHGTDNVTLLFADTNAEDEDLYTFNDQASAKLGVPITRVADAQERDPWQVFEDKRWLGNSRLAQCSHLLKQEPCRAWLTESTDPASTIVYVGIDWSETHRLPAIEAGWAPWKVDAPLTRPPYRDKERLRAEARAEGLIDPRLYRLGWSHNNCGGGCVKGGQAQWARLLEVFPERYARAEATEQKMRALLGTDVSILRDRVGGKTKPLTLTVLRERITRQPAQLDMFDEGGCGCFTEVSQ
ncbi:phosphoadenosine phosphosulfate reductase domain-containing protein [Streptomyces sp. NBC_00566]|uniref:phosphoadenosine phosphosulfate reductase domain-containing protein n=1 Tax=Streptomyces sp. NBC_00566 TaxID=2975778 RepID=UPI002E7FCBFE|nr:phosphoadenosine phosphosulfate reductase family protein [Streptomyces sp. NBC_00566]WUB88227.1 phosphoadenosine phosphosulfate reductase family protein [Streptomyces sp. NBC_00566]